MFESLDLFQTSSSMARHAAARQAVVTANVANADTPGYRALALPPFSDVYAAGESGSLRATRPGHIASDPSVLRQRPEPAHAEPSPNGNSVSVEEEMLHAVEIQREHGQALAIYRHAMTVLRMSLGR